MSLRVSRRNFGIAALAASQLKDVQLKAAPAKYTGPLDNYENKVNLQQFDPVDWTRKLHASAPLKLTFKGTGKTETLAWQKKLRKKVLELVGEFPVKAEPLQPQILESQEFPGYRRDKFVITTRPGQALLGYVLTPKKSASKYPAVICVPGHGRGVDDIVGIDDKGSERTDKAGYQHDFALQVVEQGMVAVAIEPMAFGCRRDGVTKKGGLGKSSCQPAAGAALLLGQTMIGWRVYDIKRVIDYMETRADIDASRIGCMGISGGGTATLFSTALEPRIKTAMVSGYLNTFRDSILSISHCIDNYVPGILNWAEMYDVAGLIAPRPLFAESGERDNIFPIAASKESFTKVSKVYAAMGVEGVIEHEVFPGEHSFHGVRGIPFLAKHLGA